VSKEELGHARIHTRNGAIDDRVKTEAQAFERTCRFLSYLPSSINELPPVVDPGDDPQRREQKLLSIVPKNPRRVYMMRKLIEAVIDKGSFFEIGKDWRRSGICCFAR
jgi:acetyl-CoA carboxylase carboxyltransferase component